MRRSGSSGQLIRAATYRSISLLLQAALPIAIFAPGPVTLDLRGGTNADMAPQVDFLSEIFRPNMERFGASFDFDLIRRGYFPKGGGHCSVAVKPVHSLRPVQLTDAGRVQSFFGWSYVAGSLPIKVCVGHLIAISVRDNNLIFFIHQIAHEMSSGARSVLQQIGPGNIDIQVYKESSDVAPEGNCSGIM